MYIKGTEFNFCFYRGHSCLQLTEWFICNTTSRLCLQSAGVKEAHSPCSSHTTPSQIQTGHRQKVLHAIHATCCAQVWWLSLLHSTSPTHTHPAGMSVTHSSVGWRAERWGQEDRSLQPAPVLSLGVGQLSPGKDVLSTTPVTGRCCVRPFPLLTTHARELTDQRVGLVCHYW